MSANQELFEFKFYEWEKKFRDNPYLRQPFGDEWEEYTWGKVGDMARRLATGLKSLGLRDGAHIGIYSKNCREWIISDLAIVMAGYVSVPFFPSLNGKELSYIMEYGDVDALFLGKIETWEDIKNDLPNDMPMITFPHYKGCSEVTRGFKWHDFINSYEPIQNPNKPKLSDLWTIIFTSGTTGNAKGVMLTYQAIDGIKVVLDDPNNPLGIKHDGNNDFISYLPLNHIFERVVIEWCSFRYGGTISFVETIDTFGKNLKAVQPHVFAAAPRVWTKLQVGILSKFSQKTLDILLNIPLISGLLKKLIKKGLGFTRTRIAVSGSAPMPVELIEWFRKVGIFITNGYGMTENCAICSSVDGKDFGKLNTVGKPQKGVDLKIDEETGEILMKGPFVMIGYYKNEELTEQTLRGGWLHTGDKGFLDEDNYLHITGRVADSFKTSKGEYIEPLTLEQYFVNINEIEEVCVVGLGIAQPICLIQLSEIGKKCSNEEISNLLLDRLNEVNSEVVNYKKISTLIVVKEQWTQENGIVGPTQKLKRGKIQDKYSNYYLKWHESDEKIIFE
ncbi:MAG: AMP-binding protein [Bacteroidota bacterium]|nr:AMP-binding protein [Bacteroidota bacterium]MEC8611369.1 AMP-binding protein [Bacteroidota bacterium]|tara:strand:- start:464 stop:2143 length:1680 start_codon:yes stop_codon:yes gene_type:complete